MLPILDSNACPKALRGLNIGGLLRDDESVVVPLTRGKYSLVDAKDFHLICNHLWFARKDGMNCYAANWRGKNSSGNRIMILMHREILGLYNWMETDHRDLNGLNNRRLNLRPATHSQNRANARIYTNNSSGYKGVYYDGHSWIGFVGGGKSREYLGCFKSAEAAGRAHDSAAIRKFGEFAKLNFSKS